MKAALAPCSHDVAQWVQPKKDADHIMQCCRCFHPIERERAGSPRTMGVVLFRNVLNGSYAPFSPRWA